MMHWGSYFITSEDTLLNISKWGRFYSFHAQIVSNLAKILEFLMLATNFKKIKTLYERYIPAFSLQTVCSLKSHFYYDFSPLQFSDNPGPTWHKVRGKPVARMQLSIPRLLSISQSYSSLRSSPIPPGVPLETNHFSFWCFLPFWTEEETIAFLLQRAAMRLKSILSLCKTVCKSIAFKW